MSEKSKKRLNILGIILLAIVLAAVMYFSSYGQYKQKAAERARETVIEELNWTLPWGDDTYKSVSVTGVENRFKAVDRESALYGIIDSQGNIIIPLEYSGIETGAKDGVYHIAKNLPDPNSDLSIKTHLWGYTSENGELNIEPQFTEVTPFYDEYAAVQSGDKWFIINQSGETVAEMSGDVVEMSHTGYDDCFIFYTGNYSNVGLYDADSSEIVTEIEKDVYTNIFYSGKEDIFVISRAVTDDSDENRRNIEIYDLGEEEIIFQSDEYERIYYNGAYWCAGWTVSIEDVGANNVMILLNDEFVPPIDAMFRDLDYYFGDVIYASMYENTISEGLTAEEDTKTKSFYMLKDLSKIEIAGMPHPDSVRNGSIGLITDYDNKTYKLIDGTGYITGEVPAVDLNICASEIEADYILVSAEDYQMTVNGKKIFANGIGLLSAEGEFPVPPVFEKVYVNDSNYALLTDSESGNFGIVKL